MKIYGRMMVVSVVTVGLLAAGTQAGLIYSNSFNDLTDVVASSDPGGSVAISTDRSVDAGGKSLKFADSGVNGSAYATITPSIGGNPLNDPTITAVFSFYVVNGGNDHANFRCRQDSSVLFYSLRGYPAADKLGLASPSVVDTGFSWPADQWVTFAYSIDCGANQVAVYAKPGASVGLSDYVGTYTINSGSFMNNLYFWSGWSIAADDMYLDGLKIYSELNEVPEPATCLMLLVGGIAGLLKRQ